MIWTLDVSVFFIFLLWGFLYPRNEWMGNSFTVMVFMILTMWYQPVFPELMSGKDMTGMTYPFHRLFGIFGIFGLLWSFLEQYNDLKEWWHDRRSKN